MNKFKKGWLGLTVIILMVVIWALINSYISLKYEVQEAKILSEVGAEVAVKENYLTERITWLWLLAGYLSINVYFLFRSKKTG